MDKKNKGFTLVELLAVIVILAVILVIAVPKITDVINSTRKSSIESTLKMIATSAEKEYTTREMLGTLDQANNPIGCTDIVKLSNTDYSTCNIRFNDGVATVSLSGNGKLKDYRLVGTKDNINTVTINNTYSEEILHGAYPRLDEGMIPVVIANNGTVKTIDPSSSSWYSYTNKTWANAVLVKEGVRASYKGTNNVNVTLSDILAYFVWIPRYRYELFNVEGASGTTPISIPITFESADTNKSNGTTNGQQLTHPAFTYDGMELNGIWVGKFETTGTSGSNCSNSPSEINCKSENPTILPDKQSLREQNVSTQFATSLKFSSNYYGLNSESRMMKNNEWGAVAYLSHSIYGVNQEIFINNSSYYFTGRSAGEIGTAGVPTPGYGTYSYEGYTMSGSNKMTTQILTTIASTTGNISGVYDMSGGTYEYVMGVLEDSNGKGRSGHSGMSYTKAEWIEAMNSTETTWNTLYSSGVTSIKECNSGYNGLVEIKDKSGNIYYKTNGQEFPNSKYYNIYSGTNWNTNLDYLGEALGETSEWHEDSRSFATVLHPWFIRGGDYSYAEKSGVFYFSYFYGFANNASFRVVIPS